MIHNMRCPPAEKKGSKFTYHPKMTCSDPTFITYIILESKNPQRLQNKMFSAFHDFTLIK